MPERQQPHLPPFLSSWRINLPKLSIQVLNWWQILGGRLPIGYFNGTPSNVGAYGVELNLIWTNYGVDGAVRFVNEIAANHMLAVVELIKTTPWDRQEVADKVNSLKDNPAVLAWFLFDEPSSKRGLPPQDAIDAYKFVKELDASRPIALSFVPGDPQALDYAPAMDIFMSHKYPIISGQVQFSSPELQNFYDSWLDNCKFIVNQTGKTFWAILQAHQAPDDGGDAPASPSLAETRYMLYAAIQAGSQATFFYADKETDTSHTWAMMNLAPLVKEYRKHATAFATGPLDSIDFSSQRVVATVFRDSAEPGDKLIVLIVHHDFGSVQIDFKLSMGPLHEIPLVVSLDSFDVKILTIVLSGP